MCNSLDAITDAQTAAAWVDAIEAERQRLIQHIPMRAGRAGDIRAAMLRLKAQTALMEARCRRYAETGACLRCERVPRAAGLVYCVECNAAMERYHALADVPTVAPVSVPPVGWGVEPWSVE